VKTRNKSLPKRGRPKTSALTPRELARERKKRQRAVFAKKSLLKVELLLPQSLKSAIERVSGEKSWSEVGEEAFQMWLARNK
jgi:hypothetical protein